VRWGGVVGCGEGVECGGGEGGKRHFILGAVCDYSKIILETTKGYEI